MIKKASCVIAALLIISKIAHSQQRNELSLQEAYQLLENRYPVLKNEALFDLIYKKESESLDKSKMPSVFLKADSRFQSESPSIDLPDGVSLPFEIDQPLVSGKIYLEANYIISDGGLNNAKKKIKNAELAANQQMLAVTEFSLRERVNTLFVNIILLREQLKLFDISLNDIDIRQQTAAAGVENGVLLESELIKLEVKKTELISEKNNLEFKLLGLQNTLAQLLDIQLTTTTDLIFPKLSSPENVPILDRPEQTLFRLQREIISSKAELLNASKKPGLVAFVQAGAGYPNPVNFLDNSAAPYGLIGAQFNWKITDWKKSDTDKEILALQAQKISHEEEAFIFNINSKEANYLAEVKRLQSRIKYGEKIAELQAEILLQTSAQLDEGVITSTEYTTQVNAELRARQNLLIHKAELQRIQLEFWNDRGGK